MNTAVATVLDGTAMSRSAVVSVVPHTEGPWVFHEQGDANEYCIVAADGKWVIAVLQNGELTHLRQRANMRRIVKCVNWCDRVSDNTLDRITADGGVDAVLRDRDEARVARDELLTILRMSISERAYCSKPSAAVHDMLRDVLRLFDARSRGSTWIRDFLARVGTEGERHG